MKIKYKNKFYSLEEIPLDIGYKAEAVTLYDKNSITIKIPQKCKNTQLIITLPFMDNNLLKEIINIDKTIEDLNIHTYLVLTTDEELPIFENILSLTDRERELADMYGLSLKGGILEKKLTKALILISKDGAIYYDEYPKDIYQEFNLEKLKRKILSSKDIYNKKGCEI